MCTLFFHQYSNVDIRHAILEFQICLRTERVNQNFITKLALLEIIWVYYIIHLVFLAICDPRIPHPPEIAKSQTASFMQWLVAIYSIIENVAFFFSMLCNIFLGGLFPGGPISGPYPRWPFILWSFFFFGICVASLLPLRYTHRLSVVDNQTCIFLLGSRCLVNWLAMSIPLPKGNIYLRR